MASGSCVACDVNSKQKQKQKQKQKKLNKTNRNVNKEINRHKDIITSTRDT